ncbi:putative G3BP-like protein [Hordeum vulgare]|uniref:RRM domain-containing protein n=1 Tax=Hordeum vulgare subsp. vulgare TaxID=112509 RepID=A0A8I6X5L2_HORVV|nr:nuclear transport factor 2-like isoform X1 [Hordeum vulgare subsp. vulgare]KAE8802756.1 putative G3BP-like protein [Hordeum vulgare]
MDELRREQHRIAGHPYAFEVGSYFLAGYYSVLASTPELARQFYTDGSTVVRVDCQTMESQFGETAEEINDILMSMNVEKVEIKTANFLQSWAGAITLLVTGLVQLKGYPSRKRFSQSIILAPQIKPDGFYVDSDIFQLICDEYDEHYQVADYGYANQFPQMVAHNTMTETASDYVSEELELKGFAAPADSDERGNGIIYENHEMQQQDPLEFESAINGETHFDDPAPSLPSSTDIKQDASLAPPHPPSPPTPEEEPVGEPPKQTYASVLRANAGHQVMHSTQVNRAMPGTAESQLVGQTQPVSVQEKSNLDTRQDVSVPEDEEEFLSVYVGNLSPATSVFDLEKVFQAFGKIKPDGVAIRSRKEAGVFFGFVEYENMSGIQNALDASPIELNGRLVHVEERRPGSGVFRGGGRRGRGRTADFSRGQYGGRYDGDYAARSKGNGYQRRGGRQYDGYE